MRLALRGNPTVLLPLSAPPGELVTLTPPGEELRDRAPAIVSRVAAKSFLGYATAQREKLLGLRGRNGADTPVNEAGYDGKFAMHMLRLGFQGIELLETGRITLPISEPDLTFLRGERTGAVALSEVTKRAEHDEAQLVRLGESAPVPEAPDERAVNAWLVSAYRRHWAQEARYGASFFTGNGVLGAAPLAVRGRLRANGGTPLNHPALELELSTDEGLQGVQQPRGAPGPLGPVLVSVAGPQVLGQLRQAAMYLPVVQAHDLGNPPAQRFGQSTLGFLVGRKANPEPAHHVVQSVAQFLGRQRGRAIGHIPHGGESVVDLIEFAGPSGVGRQFVRVHGSPSRGAGPKGCAFRTPPASAVSRSRPSGFP